MAHHQKHQYDLSGGSMATAPLGARPVAQFQSTEEEDVADVDEPPDHHISFARLPMPTDKTNRSGDAMSPSSTDGRKHSLLTEALLTSPNLRSMPCVDTSMSRAHSTTSNHSAFSYVSTADLTSDGGMTSPTRTSTPSPPLPAAMHTGLPLIPPKGFDGLDASHPDDGIRLPPPPTQSIANVDTTPKAEQPPRKRCITFECSRPTPSRENTDITPTKKKEPEPAKRPCILRFACPTKPTRDAEEKAQQPPKPRKSSPAPSAMANVVRSANRQHRDSESTIKDEPLESLDSKTSKPSKKARSEALRFHEFASARMEDDEWITAKPADRQKITVTDTLRKENAIRKLGEEAEEEALDEESAEDDAEMDALDEDDDDDDDDDIMNSDEDEDVSDGNETDDEEGFAASDDESEAGSAYDFWTLAATTAITAGHSPRPTGERIRARRHRATSESSIESTINTAAVPMERAERPPKVPKTRRRQRGDFFIRPRTPELPDSTDFVCGTLDEDRPLEEAYKSCMEQRRIAKHGVIPQDLDPSFPTSDPEEEEDEEDEVAGGSDSQTWVAGEPDESDHGRQVHHGRGRSDTGRSRKSMPGRSPAPSPKRLRSPPPHAGKRAFVGRSPPPRRLFGHRSPRRNLSPANRNMASPPSSPRASFTGEEPAGIKFAHIAQRPHLTHTKSLPRTPNPFWLEHHRQRLNSIDRQAEANDDEDEIMTGVQQDSHKRGPIDIVQGLERKRQRRKEKFWRQHCRQNAGKEKERRVQPGKGAERMRELGLEMADRNKAYGQPMQLVLSL